ncbi:hypothetical protein E2C01_079786 [Portunus trituberculatus]|uniref:Uncharacterized protein n=1 Tax=Portunus trituberculatus TaxID=210409 RepID=A0A5B7IWJ4_PORTR|nr:hypothetical protein [Portunus trituberculatus]
MADHQEAQASPIKIFQPRNDVLDDLSGSKLSDIIDCTCRNVIGDKLGRESWGELGEQAAREEVMSRR